MITLRKADDRFHTDIGWLDSRHSFSFGEHYHPEHMGFRALRVINDDRVRGGAGFPSHPHRDMEIITYVVDGALGHKDSMGNGTTIRPGEVQRMTAGTGVVHSEMNPSPAQTHFLQIWIVPEKPGLTPGYEQKAFPTEERTGTLRLVASRDGREGSVTVHQDVALYASVLEPGQEVAHTLAPGRHAWVQVVRGQVTLNDAPLATGDGAAVSEEQTLSLRAGAASEILVFDLA